MPTQSVLGMGARAFRDYGLPPAPPLPEPILYLDASIAESYPGTGTTWFDISGNGNHITLYGPTFVSERGGGFSFNGAGNWAYDFSRTLNFPNNALTLSVWIKHNSTSPFYQRYISLENETGVIRLEGGGNQFYVRTGGGLQFLSTSPLSVGTLYHITAVWDGTSLIVYRNGAQVAISTIGGTLSGGSKTFYISNPSETINGVLYNAMVYNVALTPSEVLALYNDTQRPL